MTVLALVPLLLAPAHAAVGISTDASPWLLRGFSAIANIDPPATPHLRTSAEVWGMDMPGFAVDLAPENQGEGWRRRVDVGIAPAIAWHPWKEGRGFHAGVMLNAMRSTVSRQGHPGEASFWTFEVLPRVGFRWFPFRDRGFFVDPWLGIGQLTRPGTPAPIGGEIYEEPPLQPIGTLHIGWRPAR